MRAQSGLARKSRWAWFMPSLLRSRLVAVSARSAKEPAPPATPDLLALRTSTAVTAGTFVWDGPDVDTGWHRHEFHQIEYALRAVAEVETPTSRHLLPPQRAVWIPAGLPHVTTLRDVRSVSA